MDKKDDWKKKKPTEKQLEAISNMMHALEWKCKVPKTRGKCSELIAEMQKEIANRLSISGTLHPRIDTDGGDCYGDWGDSEVISTGMGLGD